MKDKKLISGFIIVVIIFGLVAWFNRVDYDEIEVVVDVNDYFTMSQEEIWEMYGEPGKGRFGDKYDMGEYSLEFDYENLCVSSIRYTQDAYIKYEKSTKEIFYMIGLGDSYGDFTATERGQENVDYTNFNTGNVVLVSLKNFSKDRKSVGQVLISFKEYVPEVEVFEADFSDTEVVVDLFQFMGMSKADVYNKFGNPTTETDLGNFIYKTDSYTFTLMFDDYNRVDWTGLEFKESIAYDKSRQEILVMFGVDYKSTGINLDSIDKTWEIYTNIKYKNSYYEFSIDFDDEKKTFNEVNVWKKGR